MYQKRLAARLELSLQRSFPMLYYASMPTRLETLYSTLGGISCRVCIERSTSYYGAWRQALQSRVETWQAPGCPLSSLSSCYLHSSLSAAEQQQVLHMLVIIVAFSSSWRIRTARRLLYTTRPNYCNFTNFSSKSRKFFWRVECANYTSKLEKLSSIEFEDRSQTDRVTALTLRYNLDFWSQASYVHDPHTQTQVQKNKNKK